MNIEFNQDSEKQNDETILMQFSDYRLLLLLLLMKVVDSR